MDRALPSLPHVAETLGSPVASPRREPKALLLVTDLEDYTIAFANGLAGHVPVVLGVPRRQYAKLAEWFDPAVDLRLLDWPRHRSPANLLLLASLVRLVRRERPGVIHLLSNNTLWLNLLARARGGIPLVTTVHDVTVHPGDAETARLPGWATTAMARQSQHIVVHGESLKRQAEARFGKPPERVHVLPHPTITRYARLARREGLRAPPDRAFRVLFFGRVYAYKGLELLVRAEALVRSVPELRIVIAGRGDDAWTFRDRMGEPRRYDVRHRYIPDLEVAQLFTEADVVVLPYAEASQSGVLHVAAAFGKPVIASGVGELGRTVGRYGLGPVVPPGDADALAREIERLAADAALRDRFGARARAWAEGECAPAAVGEAAAQLYRRVSSQHAWREVKA